MNLFINYKKIKMRKSKSERKKKLGCGGEESDFIDSSSSSSDFDQ